ncbi:hypothetical protein F511_38826 [Dorcoceras hygrometricum]|uniref:Uncharacterized protein n=1 Tax=Dorcoceras hygrometricum TaxID=472368 RepID=A0A2Z7DE45_9LAMI|nr:hypothetical protein F511_38826 [Dorcoceras hygrometricum]
MTRDQLIDTSETTRELMIGRRIDITEMKRMMKVEQQCLRQHQVFRSKGRAMLTSAASLSVQGEQTCLHHHYMLNNNAYVNWSKVLFGVLEEMVDRTVKKAKGYGAQISVLLNSVPALTMGEATHFPSSKILSPKTVLTYITTNQTADTCGQSDEGGKTPVAIVKRASKSKKNSESTSDATVEIVSEVVGSKKRPAVEGSEPVVPKKRRTTKGKASASIANMDMASVVQGAVPLQVIEPTPALTAAQSPAPKRKSRKRKLILYEGSDDDNVEENIDVASVKVVEVNVEESIEKVSHVSAEQIFTETGVGYIVFGDSTADNPEELAQWLENYISEVAEQVNESDSDRVQRPVDTIDVEQLFETANVEEAEGSKHPVVEKDLVQAVGSKQVAEEHMSIDDLLLQISDDMLLPSVTTAEITKIRLGESISINEIVLAKISTNRHRYCIGEVFCQQIFEQCKRCLLTPDNATVFVIGTVRVTLAINRFGNSKFNGTSFAVNRYEHSRNIRYHDVTIRYSYNGCVTDMMTSATVE